MLNEKTTYTFQIETINEVHEDRFFNLIMFYKNGWQSIIVELKPTTENLFQLKQGLTEKFEGTMTRLYTSGSNQNNMLGCTTVFITNWHCTGTGSCAGGSCDWCNQCVSAESYTMCGSSPVEAEPYYIANLGSTSGGGSTGTNTGTTSTGSTTANDEIAVETNLEILDFGIESDQNIANEITRKIKLLIPLANNELYYLLTHVTVATDILNYLQEDNSQEAKDFIELLINNMIANPTIKFDIKKSSKSPINIDMTKVQDTSIVARKFRCVYEKLLQSSTFKNLFVNMFQDNTRPNVVFEIGDLAGNANGGLVGETTILSTNSYNNTIKIDTDLLEDGNTMYIVQTIVHECVHAFLNVKLANSSIGIPISNLNGMTFSDCINQYYNNFGDPQAQHNFIFNYMMSTIKEIFQEVKDLFVTPQQNTDIESLTLYINQNTTPTTNVATSWNWDDFYENLALNGLQSCSAFANEIATVVNGASTNVVNENKWSKYIQYRIVGFSNLPKTCN